MRISFTHDKTIVYPNFSDLPFIAPIENKAPNRFERFVEWLCLIYSTARMVVALSDISRVSNHSEIPNIRQADFRNDSISFAIQSIATDRPDLQEVGTRLDNFIKIEKPEHLDPKSLPDQIESNRIVDVSELLARLEDSGYLNREYLTSSPPNSNEGSPFEQFHADENVSPIYKIMHKEI